MPTTDSPSLPVEAGDGDYDDVLGAWTLYFDIPRREAAYFRVIVESWEDLAVIRTMKREYEGGARSLVVAMVPPGLVGPAVRSLALLGGDVGAVQVPTTPAMRDRLRADLLGEAGG